MMQRLIDLSHRIEHGMITYQGLPAPIVCDYLSRRASEASYSDGTSFHIGKIEMVANTGTYIDAPFHRFADGEDIAGLDLESIAEIAGVLIDARDAGRRIDREWFEGRELHNKAVLVLTGWSRHWRTDQYFEGHPYLTQAAARYLREQGARLVGIDSYNIDDTGDGTRPVHTTLLGAGVPIVEHLCALDQLLLHRFVFHAVPAKVVAMGTFPVRAYAVISDTR